MGNLDQFGTVTIKSTGNGQLRVNRMLALEVYGGSSDIATIVIGLASDGMHLLTGEQLAVGDSSVLDIRFKNLIAGTVRGTIASVKELTRSELFEVWLEFEAEFGGPEFGEIHNYVETGRLPQVESAVKPDLKSQLELESLTSSELGRLEALAKISALFNASSNLADVIDIAVKTLVEVTGAERGMLLLDRGGSSMEVNSFHCVGVDVDHRYSRTVVNHVLETGQPLLTCEASGDSRLGNGESKSLSVMGTRSVLCVPVRASGRDFGFFYLDSSVKAGVFDQVELDLTTVLAGMAASSLSRAEQFAEIVQGEKMSAFGLMMTGIIHELNNPLCTILSVGELLNDGGDELTQSLVDETKRCRDLVRSLLDAARSETSLQLEPLCLKETLAKTIKLVRSQFDSEGVELICELDETDCQILGSPDRISQVIINLAVNALQEVRNLEGAQVRIRVYAGDGRAYLTVADNGSGVSTINMAKLFDPFFTTKGQGEGTGLGLAVTHRIVTEHGGQIEVTNRSEGGALFSVTFPLLNALRG